MQCQADQLRGLTALIPPRTQLGHLSDVCWTAKQDDILEAENARHLVWLDAFSWLFPLLAVGSVEV